MESNVSIYLNHFVWDQYFKEGKRQLGQGHEEIGDELILMEPSTTQVRKLVFC